MISVEERIEEMKSRTKGKYITQGVSFNKNCPRQMSLLKLALENSVSFSGLIKELLASKIDGVDNFKEPLKIAEKPVIEARSIGNFI